MEVNLYSTLLDVEFKAPDNTTAADFVERLLKALYQLDRAITDIDIYDEPTLVGRVDD